MKRLIAQNKNAVITLGFFLISWALFFWALDTPLKLNFDENHYIPAARELIALTRNLVPEHPMVGKVLMAIGLLIFGDNPTGWRFMSTVFGAATIAGMYQLALTLFKNPRAAFLAAFLTLFNCLVYVQSRIGMLDTFMMAFIVWALTYFFRAVDSVPSSPSKAPWRRPLLISGALFGVAAGTKWFAFIPWAGCAGFFFFVLFKQRVGIASYRAWLIRFGLVPLVIYFATFTPILFLAEGGTIASLFTMQLDMYDAQLRVLTSHPYMSQWWQWPLLTRPMWYAFDKEGANEEWVRCVFCVGNPLIMWLGLAALGVCLWHGWQKKAFADARQVSSRILFLFAILLFSWIFIPRKIEFFYYYYPAACILSLALTHATELLRSPWRDRTQTALALGTLSLFVYFYPVLSGILMPIKEYSHWMWFRSWI